MKLRARSIGFPNSYGNEQSAGISENGTFIFYFVNNPKSKNNLQLSEKKKTSFKKSIKLKEKHINNKSSIQNSAVISNDQETLIFASDRNEGKGFDLFISKKLPNGEWGKATGLGDHINTTYDECYPYLSDNAKTLYFASKGHNSMGGFDIFVSKYDDKTKTWSAPENLGYPLNTPDDNMNICFTQNKKYAYVASYRNDSYGDLDIYRVNFENTDPSYTTLKGLIVDKDSVAMTIPLTIEVFNKRTGDLQGIYEVNSSKGSYLMILPPDKYELTIEVPGEGTFKKTFTVQGRNRYKPEINRNIQITFEPETDESQNKSR